MRASGRGLARAALRAARTSSRSSSTAAPCLQCRQSAARLSAASIDSTWISPKRRADLIAVSSPGAARSLHSTSTAAQDAGSKLDKGKIRAFEDGRLVLEAPQQSLNYVITPFDLLKDKVPKAFQRFVAVQDQDGRSLSMTSALPSDVRQLHFIPFPTNPPVLGSDSPEAQAAKLAQRVFWLTSSYVLAAAVRQVLGERGSLHLGAAPELVEDTSGGAGFSYDFLLEASHAGSSSTPSAHSDAASQIVALIEGQDSGSAIVNEDLLKEVEKAAKKLCAADIPVSVHAISANEALQHFSNQLFKAEVLAALPPETQVGLVKIGESHSDLLLPLIDGTLPPLLPTTSLVKAFKVQQWSRATWRPSSDNSPVPSKQAMIRLRGISFPNEGQLKSHLAAQEVAAASDHRAIGRAQALFMTSDAASPGSPFILPHGMRIGRKVERVIRDLYDVYGYDEVHSPQLFKKDLWVKSGHWDNYRDDMFKVQGFREESEWLANREKHDGHRCAGHGAASEGDDAFGLKPMNCPGHCLIFSSQERSYRDLPLRLAEFGPLHRNESSGSLSGLTRVRRFHQDDAHVFCTPEQVSGEIKSMLQMLTGAYRAFGFSQVELVLSTRPSQHIGELVEWDKAEAALRDALDHSGRSWSINEGDGAFYGPKIDCRLVDAAGKKHQTATIQLDFQLPRRFELRYNDPKAADGSGYSMPVMIHRAILGSVERFMAILIESSSGRWPFWISPRQASVIPVADTPEIKAHARYARDFLALGQEIADRKRDGYKAPSSAPARPLQAFHVDQDHGLDTLSKMIRKAQRAKYNFSLVIGEKEARNGTVNVRVREDYAATEPVGLPGRPVLQQDMGEWTLQDLRALFEKLDTHHW